MASLQDLPPELIAMITANLDFGSHMSLMLASKTLFGMVREVRPTQRQEWINFNINFEHHLPPRRALPILTCTLCANLHPRAMFSDAQNKKTNPTRFCIQARIKKKKYHGSRRTFRVGGVVMFGCFRCSKARPVAEEASYFPHHQLKVRFCEGCWKAAEAYLESAGHPIAD